MKQLPGHLAIYSVAFFSCGLVVAQEKCPKVNVYGPAGRTFVGDTMRFTANVDVPDPFKVGYKWRVSGGTIEEGLGTPSIVVRTGRESIAQTITASVEIAGLPAGCRNTGNEAGEVYGGDPPLLAEIEVFSGKRFRTDLDEVANDLAKYPDWILYILSSSSPGESELIVARRENSIKEYLTKIHKIDTARLVFVRGGIRHRLVKIYRIRKQKDN